MRVRDHVTERLMDVSAGAGEIKLLDAPQLESRIALDDAFVDARITTFVGEKIVELASRKRRREWTLGPVLRPGRSLAFH